MGTRWAAPPPLNRDLLNGDFTLESGGHDVEAVILVEAGSTVRELIRLADAGPRGVPVKAVVASLDLLAPQAHRDLAELEAIPIVRSARMNLEGRDATLLREHRVQNVLRHVAKAGLLWEFLVTGEQLAEVRRCLDIIPELRAAIEHMGKPNTLDRQAFTVWREDIRRLAADTGVIFKVSPGLRADAIKSVVDGTLPRASALDEVREAAEQLLATFGPARLAWGSDWPISRLIAGYGDLLTHARHIFNSVPIEGQRLIFRDVAAKQYGIGAG